MFGLARNHLRMRFRKKFVMCSHDWPLSYVVVERRSHHASVTKAKRLLQKEKIRSPNDAWKDYLKIWDRWNG